jgi:glutamine synthetase adenylyltransferase
MENEKQFETTGGKQMKQAKVYAAVAKKNVLLLSKKWREGTLYAATLYELRAAEAAEKDIESMNKFRGEGAN